jgi:hypothetical protein
MEHAPEDWRGLFANGVKYYTLFGKIIQTRYYDDYAYLPHTEAKNDDVEMTFDELKLNSATLSKALKKAAFVPCRCAFGGIGIYKYRYVKDLRYKTGANTKNAYFAALCEHIAVNLPLLETGTNYIARDLLVLHTCLRSIKDILLEYLPVKLWLFLYKKLAKPNL